jgi:hypothetical protein
MGSAYAELHELQTELWDAFSKEALSNEALAPYWELLAMYDGQAELGAALQDPAPHVPERKGEGAGKPEEESISTAEQDSAADSALGAAAAQTL